MDKIDYLEAFKDEINILATSVDGVVAILEDMDGIAYERASRGLDIQASRVFKMADTIVENGRTEYHNERKAKQKSDINPVIDT